MRADAGGLPARAPAPGRGRVVALLALLAALELVTRNVVAAPAGARPASGRWPPPRRLQPSLDDAQATAEHARLLELLGVAADADRLPRGRWQEPRPARRGGRSLGATVALLRESAYLHRPVVFERAARDAATAAAIDTGYDPRDVRGLRLSPIPQQRRVRAIYDRLRHVTAVEAAARPARFVAGVDAELGPSGVAVLEGARADSIGAYSFRNGAVVVHRHFIDLADAAGIALASAADRAEVLTNLWAVVCGRYEPPAYYDRTGARRAADGLLAMVAAHELTHGLKFHTATGSPPRGEVARAYALQHAQELIADGGGALLGARAGYSPLGLAAMPLVLALLDLRAGELGRFGSHPNGLRRYGVAYRQLARRADQPRDVFDGRGGRRAGPPLLTRAMRVELAKLPTPDEVTRFAALEQARAR